MIRPSWDEYFGYLVQVISWRSDDEETKVGAVIVDERNRVLSVGYNGTPSGTNLPKTRPEKYPFMIHSEQNCLLMCPRMDLVGCKIYILGMPPCDGCAKLLCQKKISEVVVVNPINIKDKKKWNFDSTMIMFEQCKISMRSIMVKKTITKENL